MSKYAIIDTGEQRLGICQIIRYKDLQLLISKINRHIESTNKYWRENYKDCWESLINTDPYIDQIFNSKYKAIKYAYNNYDIVYKTYNK